MNEGLDKKGSNAVNVSDEKEVDSMAGVEYGRENTRSKMAILFVLGFFALLFLLLVYAIVVRASLKELKDTLVAIIGSLSGILGFIVGYYYKSTQEK